MTETILRATTVEARNINAYRGDTRKVLIREAETRDGNKIAAGTVYQPQSGGMDAATGQTVLRVVILPDETA